MSLHYAQCEDLVVAAAGTFSRWVNSQEETSDAVLLFIGAPATLDAGTYTLQYSYDGITVAGVLNNGTADITVPAAGKGRQYETFVPPYWRILSPIAAAAERRFKLSKSWNAY